MIPNLEVPSRKSGLSQKVTSRTKENKRVLSHEHEEVSTPDEIERLWAAYEKKTKTVQPSGREQSEEEIKEESKAKEGD